MPAAIARQHGEGFNTVHKLQCTAFVSANKLSPQLSMLAFTTGIDSCQCCPVSCFCLLLKPWIPRAGTILLSLWPTGTRAYSLTLTTQNTFRSISERCPTPLWRGIECQAFLWKGKITQTTSNASGNYISGLSKYPGTWTQQRSFSIRPWSPSTCHLLLAYECIWR